MKKLLKILLTIFLLFLLYILIGIFVSYKRQPDISREYQAGFHAKDCYSDTVSNDRACIIEDNTEALRLRLGMIGQAKERVILSTFEFRADESGKDILAALFDAAKRGVDIKILADGAAAILQMDGNEYFSALAAMENVEIKIYNRINLFMPWKSMGRLHDKYVIVDRKLYILGGRNTYDYFLGDNGYKNYDRDVLVYCTKPNDEESSMRQLETYFLSVWKSDVCTDLKTGNAKKAADAQKELEERYAQIKKKYTIAKEEDYEKMTYEANKITLLSNPVHVYSKEPTLFYSLTEIMKASKGDISIHTPYIICNDWMYEALEAVCAKNPHTSLMTNSAANNGNPFGASDYLLHKDRLADTGLTIYEYEGGVSYHGKSISIGDRLSAVGSFNMDMRSVYLDTELMLVIDSKAVNKQLRENMRIYESASAKLLDKENYEIPKTVKRQKMSDAKKRRLGILKFLNWLRFLM